MSTDQQSGAIRFWQTRPFDGPPRALRFVACTLGTRGLWAGIGLSFILSVAAILENRVGISVALLAVGVFLFVEFYLAWRNSEYVEIDRSLGTVRSYSIMIWDGSREESLSDFACVDIVASVNDGPTIWSLVLERRASPRGLVVFSDETLENLRSPAERLTAATTLPLRKRAQILLDPTSAGTETEHVPSAPGR